MSTLASILDTSLSRPGGKPAAVPGTNSPRSALARRRMLLARRGLSLDEATHRAHNLDTSIQVSNISFYKL